MKVLIISDSHGNIANIKLAMGFARKIKAEAVIHSGDWDNLKAVNEVLLSEIPLYAVLGNADIHEEISNELKLKAIEFAENFLKIKLGGRKIGIVHNIKDFVIKDSDMDIVFCGHRHFGSEKVIDGIKIVAPGALHSDKPSFAVYDTNTNGVEFFDL